jgi:transposase
MKRETCFKPIKKMLQRRKRVIRKVRQTSYFIEKKKEVVNYAEQHDRRAAANHFNLNISMVRRWVRASKTWTTKTNSKKKKISSGQKALYPEAKKLL